MKQLVLGILHHFYENIFSETMHGEHGAFLEILKQIFRLHFPDFSLLTYFPLIIRYELTSITSTLR